MLFSKNEITCQLTTITACLHKARDRVMAIRTQRDQVVWIVICVICFIAPAINVMDVQSAIPATHLAFVIITLKNVSESREALSRVFLTSLVIALFAGDSLLAVIRAFHRWTFSTHSAKSLSLSNIGHVIVLVFDVILALPFKTLLTVIFIKFWWLLAATRAKSLCMSLSTKLLYSFCCICHDIFLWRNESFDNDHIIPEYMKNANQEFCYALQ